MYTITVDGRKIARFLDSGRAERKWLKLARALRKSGDAYELAIIRNGSVLRKEIKVTTSYRRAGQVEKGIACTIARVRRHLEDDE